MGQRSVWVTCARDSCKYEYRIYLSDLQRGHRRYCSQSCASKAWWEGPKGQAVKQASRAKEERRKAEDLARKQSKKTEQNIKRNIERSKSNIQKKPRGVEHGGGKTGKRGCKCEPCVERKREYMKKYHEIDRLYKKIFGNKR